MMLGVKVVLQILCCEVWLLGGVGAPRNFAQGIMVNTAYHVTFLPIFLNVAIPLQKRLQKIANNYFK